MPRSLVDQLLASDEPSVRWRVRTGVLGEDPDGRAMRRLREEIRRSPRVRQLVDGHAALHPSTYQKWRGGHWVLLALAGLGYPPGDESLVPLRDEVLRMWLAPRYFRDVDLTGTAPRPSGRVMTGQRSAVMMLAGRHRRCGSQQGAPLLAVVRLGLADERADQLASRLRHWQWPDGGWNCDERPAAATSSVYETLLPMRGLAAYAGARPDRAEGRAAGRAADRAAEVLLTRRVLFRRSTGRVIRSEWTKLHYPIYWHYDLLAALTGLTEAGRIADPRTGDGLDLLERKELPGGGWAAESTYHGFGGAGRMSSPDLVGWGPVDAGRRNDWITADALTVLTAAGRR